MRKLLSFVAILSIKLAICIGYVLGQNTAVRDVKLEQSSKSLPNSEWYALLICSDKYDDKQIPTLKGAENDCRALTEQLEQNSRLDSKRIIILSTHLPREWWPTRSNILRELNRLRDLAPDFLLVSLSAHGLVLSGRGFFLPADAQVTSLDLLRETAIELSDMRERILKTKASRVLLFADLCRNDGFSSRGLNVSRKIIQRDLDLGYVTSRELGNRRPMSVVVFATSEEQRAYECPEQSSREANNTSATYVEAPMQGCFTRTLVEGLAGGAANAIGQVTVGGLISFLKSEVPKKVRALGPGVRQDPTERIEGDEHVQNWVIAEQSLPHPITVPGTLPRMLPAVASSGLLVFPDPSLIVFGLPRTGLVTAKLFLFNDRIELSSERGSVRAVGLTTSSIKELRIRVSGDRIACMLLADHIRPLSFEVSGTKGFPRLIQFLADRCPQLKLKP